MKLAQKRAINNIIESDEMLIVIESLRRDPRKELLRMLNFLKYKMEMGDALPLPEDGVDCALLNLEGSNHVRRKSC